MEFLDRLNSFAVERHRHRLAFLAAPLALLPAPAFAHASDRGHVLLLPTGYYIAGGALAFSCWINENESKKERPSSPSTAVASAAPKTIS